MFNKQQSILSKHQTERAGVGLQTSSVESRGPAPLNTGSREHLNEVQALLDRPSRAAVAQPQVAAPVPAATTPVASNIEDTGSRLIVGPDVKLKGAEIQDCDTLIVEGSVEATMDSRVIRISQGGAFRGKVGIDIAEIHGDFEGELTARQQLIIHATGRVRGQIRYGQVLIETGGILSGDVQSIKETPPAGAVGSNDKARDSLAPKTLLSAIAG